MTKLQPLIIQRIEECYQVAESKLNRGFQRPEVNFKLRGKSAGTAHLQLNKLRFNSVLLQNNLQDFLEDVVPHEISHLLCYQLYGRVKPHGKEWQAVMINIFNRSPSTTHNFDTSKVTGKTFDYQCLCGKIPLSIRRHNKVIRQQAQYLCKRCGQQLQPEVPKRS